MRREEDVHDIAPDPELRSALRRAEGDPPLHSVDWVRLRSTINGRAELALARRRAAPGPVAARRGRGLRAWRPLLPLAAAASIAMAVWLDGGDPGEAPATAQVSAEEVFHADLSEQEFRLLVSGRADPEALLLIALD